MFHMETDVIERASLSVMAGSRVSQLVIASKSRVKQWEMAPSEELMTHSASSAAFSLGQ